MASLRTIPTTWYLSLLCGLCVLLPCQAAEGPSPATIEFTRDVVPVLTKAGCNAGACHGSFQGRGGFRLSLLGFDPAADHDAIVREARGRRVFPAAVEQSLILAKPTLGVPHGGKQRLTLDSVSYQILHRWIAEGLRPPRADGPRVSRLEATPNDLLLASNQATQLSVRAVWSDGVVQDATPWALYESTADQVAAVTSSGSVKATGAGRAAVTIRYLGQVAAVPITVPHGQAGELAGPIGTFLDPLVWAEWKKLGLQPAARCSDSEFLRRIHLDLIGTLPTPNEVRTFLADRRPDKRILLIDALLERPEYSDYWALKWADLLRVHRRSLGEKGLGSFNGWLRQSLRENRPVDRMVRELLTAQGNLYAAGPVAFFFIDRTPEDLAETTAQLFLGIRLQCAKCHHHPFDVWSQDDYHGMAAFFARVQRKDTGEEGRFGGAQSLKLATTGSVNHPRTGQPVAPRPLGGEAVEANRADPRHALADWITSRSNPYFARNLVNRTWGYLFGRGLVEPSDDLRPTNPPLFPTVLDALAKDFVEHGHDLKHLLRTLCRSELYQRASETAPARDHDGSLFTHRRPRRLPAEVLLDAINAAAGTTEKFDGLPLGTRAIALPDSAVVSSFLDTFGRPKRTTTCECERGTRPDLGQVLRLANSEMLHTKVTAPQGRVALLLAANKPDEEIAEELYLATLARPPDGKEREVVRRLLAAGPNRKEVLEDLLWALLNSAEFVFNH